MSLRITKDVTRPQAVTIQVNGRDVTAYEGESLATALLAAGIVRTYCNMGVCFDCLVEIEEQGQGLRVRACLTAVRAGLRVTVPSG
jgi:predicted molibdopterin-dependent oxidoreductase YjgC